VNYWSQTKKQGEINKDLEAYVWQLQRQARHSRDCLLKATAKQQASAASTGNRSWLRKCFKTGVKKKPGNANFHKIYERDDYDMLLKCLECLEINFH